jgi:hypothetical protein
MNGFAPASPSNSPVTNLSLPVFLPVCSQVNDPSAGAEFYDRVAGAVGLFLGQLKGLGQELQTEHEDTVKVCLSASVCLPVCLSVCLPVFLTLACLPCLRMLFQAHKTNSTEVLRLKMWADGCLARVESAESTAQLRTLLVEGVVLPVCLPVCLPNGLPVCLPNGLPLCHLSDCQSGDSGQTNAERFAIPPPRRGQ